jgi:hypothetical protein
MIFFARHKFGGFLHSFNAKAAAPGGKPLGHIIWDVQRNFHVAKFSTRMLIGDGHALRRSAARNKSKPAAF